METTAPLILIALLAVVVIVGIVWGIKLRRDRRATDDIVAANRSAAKQDVPASAVIAPVAPSPPPLADEPIVAAAAFDATPASIAVEMAEPEPELVPEPVAAPTPDPAPAPAPASSDLSQLKGLGPKLVATLAELGITRIDQIAALSPEEAQDLDARLGNFRGRLARDRWIEQAQFLTAGDRTGYEAEFGKLG